MSAERHTIFSPDAPKGRGPFPQALQYGNLLFLSGQGPLDPEQNEPDTGSFEHEVRLTFQNVENILRAAGTDFAHALRINIYLADLANVPRFNELYREYFSEPFPARTTIQAGLRGIQVEVDGIFSVPQDN